MGLGPELAEAAARIAEARARHGPGSDGLEEATVEAETFLHEASTRRRSDEMAVAEVCWREALELSEESDDVHLKQGVLTSLANLSCQPNQGVGPAEAAALRSRLNALYAQNGRIPDTSCTICLEPLEPLEQPGGGADEGAAGDRGCAVRVLQCGHQFHLSCLCTWWLTRSDQVCPLCKK